MQFEKKLREYWPLTNKKESKEWWDPLSSAVPAKQSGGQQKERRGRREAEAELWCIPAKAMSNDVTFRKKKKEKQRRKETKKLGYKVRAKSTNLDVAQDNYSLGTQMYVSSPFHSHTQCFTVTYCQWLVAYCNYLVTALQSILCLETHPSENSSNAELKNIKYAERRYSRYWSYLCIHIYINWREILK